MRVSARDGGRSRDRCPRLPTAAPTPIGALPQAHHQRLWGVPPPTSHLRPRALGCVVVVLHTVVRPYHCSRAHLRTQCPPPTPHTSRPTQACWRARRPCSAAGTCQWHGVLCPSGIVLPRLNGSDRMGVWALGLVPPCALWVDRRASGTRTTCNVIGTKSAAACVARLLKRDADVEIRYGARDFHLFPSYSSTPYIFCPLVFHTYQLLHPDPL